MILKFLVLIALRYISFSSCVRNLLIDSIEEMKLISNIFNIQSFITSIILPVDTEIVN